VREPEVPASIETRRIDPCIGRHLVIVTRDASVINDGQAVLRRSSLTALRRTYRAASCTYRAVNIPGYLLTAVAVKTISSGTRGRQRFYSQSGDGEKSLGSKPPRA